MKIKIWSGFYTLSFFRKRKKGSSEAPHGQGEFSPDGANMRGLRWQREVCLVDVAKSTGGELALF
jgi:hypothetical protein